MRSREIVEIMADVMREVAKDCTLRVIDRRGSLMEIDCPEINYIFGNAMYIKERLDELSTTGGEVMKFPLIALYCPFTEERNNPKFHSKAKVRMLIATGSSREWNNEERLVYSFRNVLRPIYDSFIKALKADGRFDFGYEGKVKHSYSENYSYGKYGAVTASGDEVSETIDAIDISNLELIVKLTNCRTR
ncbi:MAG: hypothetical protein K2M69_02050 [Muribaculaceae bacterium]|nr:hypothetical protein [Muribaculaceae bacterium]